MNTLERVVASFKKFSMRFSGSQRSWLWGGGLGRTRVDYAAQVGDGRGNSIVVACLAWMGRTLPEAPIHVVKTRRDGTEEVVHNHPLTRLLNRPNPYYSGALLLDATVKDFKATGNAYWLKVPSAAGRTVELWWVPSTLIEPKFPDDGSVFISHYEYRPNGAPIRIETRDVVHFRNGIDPQNPRKGLSEIAALVREIATDDEAADYTASILRNLGVVGVVIAPADNDTIVSQEDADRIKSEFGPRFGGDNRGQTLVLSTNVKVTSLDSFSPQQMDLTALRAIPEGRISAVLGIPAAVVGLPMGLSNTKVGATMAEMREQAYESCIIPTQRLFAAEITVQLLPDLGNAAMERVEFDLSQVRVLQPDLDKMYTRLDVAVRGGWMMPNEARAEIDLDPVPGGDVLYVPVGVIPTDPKMLIPPEPEPLALPAPEDDEEEPTPLRALPSGKGLSSELQHFEVKSAASNLAGGLSRLRARHQAPLERELAGYLALQRARVIDAIGRKASRPGPEGGLVIMQARTDVETKGLTWRDVFDAIAEEKGLRRVLERWYRRILGGTHELTEDALGISFDLDDPTTRAYLVEAGSLIKDITEHTRSDIARALQEGQAAGEGIPQLAKRIEDLTAFNRARATTIARTELGQASNEAALTSYEASGVVVGVQVFDGHDDEPCRSMNGRKLTLAEARTVPRLAHPRCVRAFGAIVDASELEKVA